MKKRIPLLIFCSFLLALSVTTFVPSSYAQTLSVPVLKPGWYRVYIENVGSIDLPPTMEVQAGEYKEFVDNGLVSLGLHVEQLVAQQKGLNEIRRPTGKYARVMVGTEIGSYGDYGTLNFDIHEYTQSDIAELDIIIKQQNQQELANIQQPGLGQMKIIKWYPIKLEIINGMSCLHISYTRQLNDNLLVLVHMYGFQNNDRMHRLTMSYRLSEADYWQADFTDILNSFRITNIR